MSEYWKKRGTNYYNEMQNKRQREKSLYKTQERYVKKILNGQKYENILEIGCGFGRYTQILYDLFKPKKYVAIDLSIDQLKNAKNYVKHKDINFICTTIQNLNLQSKFDLVFTSEVLMHIDFKDIETVIEKLVSLSRNKIISIDWCNEFFIGQKLGNFCFMHDYQNLFQKLGTSCIIHPIPLPLILRLYNVYARIRGKSGYEKQRMMVIEV